MRPNGTTRAQYEMIVRRTEGRLARQLARAQRHASRDDVQRLIDRFRPHCGKQNELLLPRATYDALPRIRETEGRSTAMAAVKFFDPSGSWTWYVTEAGPVYDERGRLVDIEFFGLVKGTFFEYGYFTLRELGQIRNRFGLPIERDLSWTPRPVRSLAD
jgi:hypothetical protein